MNLEDFGFSDSFKQYVAENKLTEFVIGRVVSEHKEQYRVRTIDGDLDAEITGNMRFSASGRKDFPAVGDWVTLVLCDGDFAIIHHILPRYSIIERRRVGIDGEVQIIGANIDYAFLVQSVDRDFNINRLERYLTICASSQITPIIVLTKTDLTTEEKLYDIINEVQLRIKNVQVIPVSDKISNGYDNLFKLIEKGKTYCALGSSGVGKSTLINGLLARNIMKTSEISESTGKGRHITSHREMFVLENGGIIIDNPGMREVGISDVSNGLETTFDKITGLAKSCRFTNCSHTIEKGCAVLDAINRGELDRAYYKNYQKMIKEKVFFESSAIELRKKDKEFGKMIKNYKKNFKSKD